MAITGILSGLNQVNSNSMLGANSTVTGSQYPSQATAQSQSPVTDSLSTGANITTPVNQGTTYAPTNITAPTSWDVSGNQTVAGNMNQLTSDNSPYIQLARTHALEGQNARGILNSSMTQTASDAAAYQAALPIAQADASTYAKAAGYNADQVNQDNIKNADASNTAKQYASTVANNINMSNVDEANKAQLQTLASQNQTLIATNNNAASLFNQTMGAINNIQNNATMDAATKAKAINTYYALLKNQLAVLGQTQGLNLSSLLLDSPMA
jgi:hypothetical protein